MKDKNNNLKRKKNILYTGFGDKGTTTLFNCDQQRISKSADIIEALGSIDELNAYLGVVKVNAGKEKVKSEIIYSELLEKIQQTIFVIQAEVAGSDMTVDQKDLDEIEDVINKIGDILPPITSFTISGGSLLSAQLDYVRTLARRAERKVISVEEERASSVGPITISYLNRLSSVFFAMSRYANHLHSIPEEHPDYNK